MIVFLSVMEGFCAQPGAGNQLPPHLVGIRSGPNLGNVPSNGPPKRFFNQDRKGRADANLFPFGTPQPDAASYPGFAS
jgi:hypothetical protein